ncbi:MAG: hypothetical protein EB078_08545 [Proteobacteria bacterium]|nr:hypothetical protein [Pseudomonadota bacterium]NDD04941.1 hypothetical protein [Pseudomonadota bacterium]
MPPKPTTGAGAGAALKLELKPLDTGAEKPDAGGMPAEKDDSENLVAAGAGAGVGAGDTGVGLLAASNAFAFKSLSPPANIIPDNVPVKNVAIGIINSKNF